MSQFKFLSKNDPKVKYLSAESVVSPPPSESQAITDSAAPEKKSPKRKERKDFDKIYTEAISLEWIVNDLHRQIKCCSLNNDLFIYVTFLVVFMFAYEEEREDTESNFFAMHSTKAQVLKSIFPTTETNVNSFSFQTKFTRSVRVPRDKVYRDISDRDDWNIWFVDGLLRNVFDCHPRRANLSHDPLYAMGSNIHVGSMRVRTIRARPDSCSVNKYLYPSTRKSSTPDLRCYAEIEGASEEREEAFCGSRYVPHEEAPYSALTARRGSYHGGGYSMLIPFNASCLQALQIAARHITNVSCSFADNFATRLLVVEYFIYTPQSDVFHAIKLFVEVTTGGAWVPQHLFQSFKLPSMTLRSIVLHASVQLYVVYYVAAFALEGFRAAQKKELLSFVTNLWNVFELMNLIIFILSFVFRYWWWTQSSAHKEFVFPFRHDRYASELDEVRRLYIMKNDLTALNFVVTFLKLLEYVGASHRWGGLVRSLRMAQAHIVSLLFLFFLITLGYGIVGMVSYGHNVEDFHTLHRSMVTLLSIVVGRNGSWGAKYGKMREQHRQFTFFYFWSFFIIAKFMLLNMIIGILAESYRKVYGGVTKSFDESAAEFWLECRHLLSRSHIACKIKLHCRGKSTAGQLRHAVEDLEKKLSEGMTHVDRPQFRQWVRKDVQENLGYEFMENLWERFIIDYEDEMKREVEVRHDGYGKGWKDGLGEMSKKLQKIDRVDRALDDLIEAVGTLHERLRREVHRRERYQERSRLCTTQKN